MPRRMMFRRTIWLFSIMVIAAGSVFAQFTAGIQGEVKDQSGAGLPGVTITVIQTDTGLTRSAVSDEEGSYILQNLPIGPYRLSQCDAIGARRERELVHQAVCRIAAS